MYNRTLFGNKQNEALIHANNMDERENMLSKILWPYGTT